MDQAKIKIQELVNKYSSVLNSRSIKKYTEEETKKGFIEPLFTVLGWDISNKEEVTAEESQLQGRVDYGFYLNGRIKFYVEAKSLKADIHNEDYAKQAIRYSWNKGVDWAILTDFESLKVFYCQDPTQSLFSKLVFEIKFDEFIDRLDQLWLLSKESFNTNKLDEYAIQHGKKLQKISVGDQLYKHLNECRKLLIEKLGVWNGIKDRNLLDEGVQRLLDRLIFIRVAEDRGIEPPTLIPLVRAWQNDKKGKTIYESMIDKFRELDSIYNSSLFTEHPFEKWDESPGVTENVIEILQGKAGYYEYDFKVMPADVLGAVYENYLGHRLAQSEKGVTADKDSKKRKEQGIYYTPEFIVDYIVKNTLKPVLDRCRSIDDIKRIKVLDPACGSGSFLIKALEVINDKYKEFGNKGDEYTKITILLENIYGVDLDEQAIEITRLNLLLNTLEKRMQLPKLDKNIRNGNSLISGTEDELRKYFGKNYRDKKPFNWEEKFPEVFKQGGFDVIIGNPPYINAIQLKEIAGENVKDFWKEKFQSAKGTYDIYILFFEQALKICRKDGYVSFITPNKYLSSPYGESLRKFIADNFILEKILNVSDLKIFLGPSVYPVITIIKNNKPPSSYQIITEKALTDDLSNIKNAKIDSNILKKMPEYLWGPILSENIKIINKVFSNNFSLGEVSEVQATSTAAEADEFSQYIDENKVGLPIINSGTIDRYATSYGMTTFQNTRKQLQEPYPDGSKIGYKRKNLYNSPKILIAKLALKVEGFLDYGKFASINTNCIHSPKSGSSLEYLAAIVNSKLISFVYSEIFSGLKMGGGYFQFQAPQLRVLPIAKATEDQQRELIKLVHKIINLKKVFQSTPKDSNKSLSLDEEIERIDRKIDEEVYKLYGLTPEEIAIAKWYAPCTPLGCVK